MIFVVGCSHIRDLFGWESLIKSMLSWKHLSLTCEQSFLGARRVNVRSLFGYSILETSLASSNTFSGL